MKNMKTWALTLFLLAAAAPLVHGQATTIDEIERYIKPFADQGHFSGVVLFAKNGEVIYEKAFGLANASHRIPNQVNSVFGIASVTKDITLAIAKAMIDEGKLKEADTLDKFVPDFPQGKEITIAMQAMHRSGIPHRVNAKEDQPYLASDIVELASKSELAFDPGSKRLYSSAGYSVLARALEVASGKTYRELLNAYILEPSGMTHTDDFDGERVLESLATPYLLDSTGLLNAPVKDYSFLVGAGSIFSTAHDVYRFGVAVADGKLGEGARTGLVNSRGRINANGSTNGYRCNLRIDTESKSGFVLISNLASGANDLIVNNLQKIMDGEAAEKPVVPNPKLALQVRRDLSEFEGTYSLGSSKFNLFVKGGELFAGPYKLVPLENNRFYNYWSYAEITFERDEGQNVVGLIWEGSAGKTVWRKE